LSKGRLIAIEGIDKSGKTTLARLLARKLSSKGLNVLVTYEPWHPRITEVINETTSQGVDGEVEALLFAADRLLHVRKLILPALESGEWVITDRYVYSSIAYQTARGADRKWIEEVNRYAIQPDLTILLDIDPALSLKRKGNRRLQGLEKIEYLENIRKTYLELAKEYGFLVLDANEDPEILANNVMKVLREKGWIR
jgi:dTMP kinase